MPTAAVAPQPISPAATWKALAHLIAARPTIRLWNPDTDKFDRTANLTSRLPRQPAAVPLYQRGRTCLLHLISTPNATPAPPLTTTSPWR